MCCQSLLHQEIVKAPQDSSRLMICIATGELLLKKFIYERSENALERSVDWIIVRISPARNPNRHANKRMA